MTDRFSVLIAVCGVAAGCVDYRVKRFGDGGAPISDVADSAERQSDFWEASKTDLIFFGDTSDSMTAELETMGDHARTFMDRLDDYDSDWRMAVVTGPSGCAVGGTISTDVADYTDRFAEALVTPPDADAVALGADEWGLHNVTQAVEASRPGGCNEGFLRDGALLHIVVLSDEPDTSPGSEAGDGYWEAYVDAMQAAKGDGQSVTISGVVGPVPDGCDGAYPGAGYAEAIDATGGALLSICDSWTDSLGVLVLASVQVSDFPLSRLPDPTTLEVLVNDGVRTSGWEYQSAENRVHFTEALPTLSYTVTIRYAVADGA